MADLPQPLDTDSDGGVPVQYPREEDPMDALSHLVFASQADIDSALADQFKSNDWGSAEEHFPASAPSRAYELEDPEAISLRSYFAPWPEDDDSDPFQKLELETDRNLVAIERTDDAVYETRETVQRLVNLWEIPSAVLALAFPLPSSPWLSLCRPRLGFPSRRQPFHHTYHTQRCCR